MEKTEEAHSRIVMSSDAKDRSLTGIVCECGPDCVRVKPGDKILYARHSWMDLPWISRDHPYYDKFIMNEDDVLCTIDESEEK